MPHNLRIALAPGDGIGPEIMDATLAVFKAAGVLGPAEFVPVEMGEAVYTRGDTRGMTDEAIRTVEACGVLFKGPMATPKGGGRSGARAGGQGGTPAGSDLKSINVTARKLWSAYANYRHFRSLPGVITPFSRAGVAVNFSIVRENIEDTYGGIEHRLSNDTFQCKRIISAPGCDEICRFAFEKAASLGLTRVHCGHKANIMKMTDGLLLSRFYEAAKRFPGIEAADVIVDALCMNLVLKPQQYQMIVLPNLQGDIVSDLAAGLVGGLGFAPSANIGKHISIFEAVHGTAPDIAGKGIANPTSLLLSGVMMLRHLGLGGPAAAIENALLTALEEGVRTGDFGDAARPALGTRVFAGAIIERLGRTPRTVPPAADGAAATRTVDPLSHGARAHPPQVLLRTFAGTTSRIVGCEFDIDTTLSAAALAEELHKAAEGTPFRLVLISNRGTQVWPTGSVYTECVDCSRARFELRDAPASATIEQTHAVALLERLLREFTVSGYDLLRSFDGVAGYSAAQGQKRA